MLGSEDAGWESDTLEGTYTALNAAGSVDIAWEQISVSQSYSVGASAYQLASDRMMTDGSNSAEAVTLGDLELTGDITGVNASFTGAVKGRRTINITTAANTNTRVGAYGSSVGIVEASGYLSSTAVATLSVSLGITGLTAGKLSVITNAREYADIWMPQRGTSQPAVIMFQNAEENVFTVTKDNAGTINVYEEGGAWKIQNNTASARSLYYVCHAQGDLTLLE